MHPGDKMGLVAGEVCVEAPTPHAASTSIAQLLISENDASFSEGIKGLCRYLAEDSSSSMSLMIHTVYWPLYAAFAIVGNVC